MSYKVSDAQNQEINTGSITIADINKGVSLKVFQSLRRMTWDYLSQYDANLSVMSKRCMEQLLNEL